MQSIYLATIFAGALVCLLLFAPVVQEAFLKPTTPYATAIPASRNDDLQDQQADLIIVSAKSEQQAVFIIQPCTV